MAGSERQQSDTFQEDNERTRADRKEFWVDMVGTPHWDGIDMRYMKKYKELVRLEYEAKHSDDDWANSQRATLGLRLTRGLSGRAWDAVKPLLRDLTKLMTDGGHKLVITALEDMKSWTKPRCRMSKASSTGLSSARCDGTGKKCGSM